MESEGLASRDRRREVPRIEMDVVGFDRAAGPSLGSCVGDAVVSAGISTMLYPYSPSSIGAVTVISAPKSFPSRAASGALPIFMAGRVEEQNRITRKIVLFGTFRHGFEGQRSAGIGFLGRNRQAQGDREKNGFLTIHG